MANYNNLSKKSKPSFIQQVGNKLKTAFEYGMAAKGLYDMGRHIYQGASVYGPAIYNTLRTIGPAAATVAAEI